MRVPYWFILVAMSLGIAFPWTPYFRLRFSMREMLVAVSVLAGILGLLAYAARN
jgi:hypothetical protein